MICLLICFVEQNVYGWGVLGILLNAHDINLICIDVFVVNALEWVRVMIIVRAIILTKIYFEMGKNNLVFVIHGDVS